MVLYLQIISFNINANDHVVFDNVHVMKSEFENIGDLSFDMLSFDIIASDHVVLDNVHVMESEFEKILRKKCICLPKTDYSVIFMENIKVKVRVSVWRKVRVRVRNRTFSITTPCKNIFERDLSSYVVP